MRARGVKVICHKQSKKSLQLYAEHGWEPSKPHWCVTHWGKHKSIFYDEARANEYAEDLCRKLERERSEREWKLRQQRDHWAYLRKQEQERAMQKTNVNPAILQPFLESAANAGAKGQAQFFTPIPWAEALSQPLPRYRPTIIDLSCGAGNLLQGSSRPSTVSLLGCDIDPCQLVSGDINRIAGDVTKLYRLMRQVSLQADCFTLNPAWDPHQYREALQDLAESDLPTVRKAFAAHDGRTGKDTIDSTVASLCLALDLCSHYGEGLLIANESTLQRLVLAPQAPHGALSVHVWAHLVIQGNPMTGLQDCAHQEDTQFFTGVLYFARGHDSGPPSSGSTLYRPPVVKSLEEAKQVCAELHRRRPELRLGPEVKSYAHTEDTADKWKAIGQEWERLTRKDKPQWNISLRSDGTIKTDLSLYDSQSGRVSKEEANGLFQMEGKQPIQLVMQRQQRAHLEKAAFGTVWRVDPKLQEAVRQAVLDYSAVRAPLYPLAPIQRLGYLDEQDDIVCSKDLGGGDVSSPMAPPLGGVSSPAFRADCSYKLRSTTIAVKRSGTKLNLMGEEDEVEWDGQELAFFITDDSGVERIFMEGRLRAENVRLSILKPGEKPGKQDEDCIETCAVDFTLQDLVGHFIIPDVLDVARVNPEGYQRNLDLLKEIEELCA
jgi:hypothetical protein